MFGKRPPLVFSIKDLDKYYQIHGWKPKKNRTKRKWTALEYVQQFFLQTNLHGFKYLAESGRPFIERLFWITAIVLVYAACFIVVRETYANWVRSPVMLSFENAPRQVSTVPFPAVTVCSNNQVPPSKFNFTAAMLKDREDMSEQEYRILTYTSLVCNGYVPEDFNDTVYNQEFLDYVASMSPSCEDTVRSFRWLSHESHHPCSEFQPVLTSHGVCYSFNMLPFSYILQNVTDTYQDPEDVLQKNITWSPDKGYDNPNNMFQHDYPVRTSGSGYSNSLLLFLDYNAQDFDPGCTYGARTFSVYIHNPSEFPKPGQPGFFVAVDTAVTGVVTPKVQITDESLQSLSPQIRGCYMSKEKNLKFFKIYSKENCNSECEANISLAVCGCVALFHPRMSSTPVCGPMKMECVQSAIRDSTHEQMLKQGNALNCDCLPSCSDIEYDVSIFTETRDWDIFLKGHKLNGHEVKESSYAVTFIHFKDVQVNGLIRTRIFDVTDFISNIGGLLSVFLGFSMFSLIEIFYFSTLRILTNFWNKSIRRRRVASVLQHDNSFDNRTYRY